MVRRVFDVILLLVVAASVRAGEWENLRARPGNDDVFVMIETSRSMASAADGSLPVVKAFVQDLFARYLKEGDRVVLMTFDSDARLSGFVSVVQRRRDVELLREIVDAIDVRRPIRYRGTWPDLTETPDGPWMGGPEFADYCEMWRLAGRVLQTYGDPSRRQLLLLFTDGSSASPAYRRCDDARLPASILTALRDNRLRMGLLLTSRPSSPTSLSPRWRPLVNQLSGHGILADAWRVIELRGGREGVAAEREVLDLLNARVDLITPESVRVVLTGSEELRVPVTVVNRSAAARTIGIRAAVLQLRDDTTQLPLTVTPASVTVGAGQSATLTLSSQGLFQKPGTYRGDVVVRFGNGARFDPALLPVNVTKQTWLEHHLSGPAQPAVMTAIALTCLILGHVFERVRSSAVIVGTVRKIRWRLRR